jgi:multiple sugar transport system permease protein
MSANRSLWLFILPSVALMMVVLIYPLAAAVSYSFTDFTLTGNAKRFVGLENYLSLLADPRFYSDLLNTVIIVGCSVALQLVLGFLIALALYGLARGAQAISLLNFLPHVVTPVVAAIFLKWMFVGRWGLIDSTLISFDIFPPDWLGNPVWAKVTVIVADTWKFMPFVMLVLYAGLQSFDQSLLEAASIDGASGVQRVRYIILPMLKPLILFVASIRIMDAFRFFDLIYVLTDGGPANATETITLYTYIVGFRTLEIGRASALGMLTLIMVMGVIWGLIALLERQGREAL